jgi:membrane protein implicated in regulation of membrane protease activity
VFLLVGLVLALLLPSPWSLVAIVVCIPMFIGELLFWSRSVRGQPKRVDAETLIGRTATVVTPCRPWGQVRLGGETWEARCDEGAYRGEKVVITARNDLTLVVERT